MPAAAQQTGPEKAEHRGSGATISATRNISAYNQGMMATRRRILTASPGNPPLRGGTEGHDMKAASRHLGTWRGVVALLVVGALAACTGQQEAAPPATNAPATSPAAELTADAPIPDT